MKEGRVPHPISQTVDVTATKTLVAFQPLSGYVLMRPEDNDAPAFLPADSVAVALGVALNDALGRSRYVPPDDRDFYDMAKHVRNHGDSEREVLRRTGGKSKREAYENAVWCRVERAEGQIRIWPHRPDKPGTWDALPEAQCVVIPSSASEDALGNALKTAIERGRTFKG